MFDGDTIFALGTGIVPGCSETGSQMGNPYRSFGNTEPAGIEGAVLGNDVTTDDRIGGKQRPWW